MAVGHRESAREGASLFFSGQKLLAVSHDLPRSLVPEVPALAQDGTDLIPERVPIVRDERLLDKDLPARWMGDEAGRRLFATLSA